MSICTKVTLTKCRDPTFYLNLKLLVVRNHNYLLFEAILNNEIVVETGDECEECPIFYWPDELTATKCLPIDLTYMKLDDPFGIILLFGIAIVMFVLHFFVKNKTNKLIKASSRELSIIILLGIILEFVTVIIIVMKPTDLLCKLSTSGFNWAIVVIYAPLLAKTNRVYRIFKAGKSGKIGPPPFISNRSQGFFIFILIMG